MVNGFIICPSSLRNKGCWGQQNWPQCVEGAVHLRSTSALEPSAFAHSGLASPALCRQERDCSLPCSCWEFPSRHHLFFCTGMYHNIGRTALSLCLVPHLMVAAGHQAEAFPSHTPQSHCLSQLSGHVPHQNIFTISVALGCIFQCCYLVHPSIFLLTVISPSSIRPSQPIHSLPYF